ncbi:MAG: hypothetical protein FWE34_07090 [Defluviitaleaceae bacterium]|nr:hypothetical protein [Defluviitaleaceae bacterium]
MLTTRTNHITGEIALETDPPNSLPDHVVTKTVEINPNMPFPTHEVRLEMWRLPEDSEHREMGYEYEIAILITGQRQANFGVSSTWQTIRGLRAGHDYGRWIDIDPENPLNLHFADFNGDGYMDMALRHFPPQTGGMAYDSHYFWLWNPDAPSWQGSFERNYSLEYIASFGQVVSVENGYVTIFHFQSVMYQSWATYTYIDGEFVLVSYQSVEPE